MVLEDDFIGVVSLVDEDVEVVYTMIDDVIFDSRKCGHAMILGGDFNAQVGGWREGDDCQVIGISPLQHRSARGEMLTQWCWLHSFCIANSFGCDDEALLWTYRNGDSHRQLDYIISDIFCQVLFFFDFVVCVRLL